MKSKLKKLILNIDYAIQPVLMTTLLVVALIQVLYRFVPWIKAPWSLEIITFLFSSSVWFGISIAIKEDAHVGIKALYDRFPLKIRRVLKIVSLLLFGAMMMAFGYLGTVVISGYFSSGTLTPAAHLPYWLVRSPIILGCLLSLYRIVEKIIKIIKNEDPEFDVVDTSDEKIKVSVDENYERSEVTL